MKACLLAALAPKFSVYFSMTTVALSTCDSFSICVAVCVINLFQLWATRDSHHVARENNVEVDMECPHIGTAVAYQYTSHAVENIKGISEVSLLALEKSVYLACTCCERD